eukprot:4495880-Heterocapsa_arctica.AAC.1
MTVLVVDELEGAVRVRDQRRPLLRGGGGSLLKPVLPETCLKALKGLRASSLSPLDSSQNAAHFSQNLSMRVNIEPQKHCF